MRASISRLALLSVLLGASIALTTPVQGLGQEESQRQAVDVAVENHTDMPARVYVRQHGHMVPVGLVEGMTSETLPLPDFFAQSSEPVRLVADLIGADRWHESDPVAVGPPTTLEFTIESNLARSTVVSR